MIIVISGKMHSGKDKTAEVLQYLFNCNDTKLLHKTSEQHFKNWLECGYKNTTFTIKKFAYPVKQICAILLGVPVERFEDEDFKNSYLPAKWNTEHLNCSCDQLELGYIENHKCSNCDTPTVYECHTVRWLMQEVGTRIGRGIHPDTWCNIMDTNIKNNIIQGNVSNWLITDMRFHNEVDCLIPYNPILIRVERPFVARFRKEINTWLETESFTGYEQDVEVLFKKYLKKGNEAEQSLYYSIIHQSETALDNYPFAHYIYNEGTISDLIMQCKQLLQSLNLIK